MSAYDPSPLFDALESKLAASGFSLDTLDHEPSDPPAQATAVVMFMGVSITETSLATGSGPVSFNVRFYYDAMAEPRGETEKQIARWACQVLYDLSGDFDLGDASVRNILPLMDSNAGFQTISGKWYRVCDIRVDVLVNDLVTHTK